MELVTSEFKTMVTALIAEVGPHNCDPEEYRLAQAFQALPICFSLWCYMLLTANGKVVSTGLDTERYEPRSASAQEVLLMLRIGAERYPQLALLLPSRPADAVSCGLCAGSGVMRTGDTPPQQKRCLFCEGWGWLLFVPGTEEGKYF